MSVQQLAKDLKLSQGTVSIVLNGRGNEMRISQKTQARVLEAAQKLGFSPNAYGKRSRGGRENRPQTIAFFTPYMMPATPVGRSLHGIQEAILHKGINADIVLQTFEYDRLSERTHLLSPQVCDGAVLVAMSEEDTAELLRGSFDIPIVLYNRVTEKYGSVCVDDYEAGAKVAELFKARGHSSVGLIMPIGRNKSGSMRQIGFMDRCAQLGLVVRPEHIQEDVLSFDGGYAAAQRMARISPLPQAVFVMISDMAIGALPSLAKAGIHVPRQMELVSYGNNPLESFVQPSLTTFNLPVEGMTAACVELVQKMLQTDDWTPSSQIYPLELIVRESCGGFPESGRSRPDDVASE